MNGTTSEMREEPIAGRQPQRPPISPALLRGGRELTAYFEKRLASFRAEYEERIRTLTQERDAALASRASNTPGPVDNALLYHEIENLRQENENFKNERARWERAEIQHANERLTWENEIRRLRVENREAAQAREELLKAQEAWQQERAALQQQYETLRRESDAKLQEVIASKDAIIQELEARAKWLESAQAGQSVEQPTVRDSDQNKFDALDIFQSPPQPESTYHPSSSTTMGTISSINSPTSDNVAMQVDEPSRPSPPKSPTVTLRGGHSPTGTMHDGRSPSPSVARSPTMFSVSSDPRPPVDRPEPTRLVIRVPPPSDPVRKPLKSPVSPVTEEERKTIVQIPPMQGSSDGGSPSKTSTTSVSSPGSSSS
ncbi:hypothetical protein C8Q77DRAFT_176865 [Trametes polyzona]|nr:hypothetical protein C8Q77DRAFT_176865 [Trametes polyzona]